eukprot:1390378-Karenia_brevis.AAC.1
MKIHRLKNDEMVAHVQLDKEYFYDDANMSFSVLASYATHIFVVVNFGGILFVWPEQQTYKGKAKGKGDASRCYAGLSVGNM